MRIHRVVRVGVVLCTVLATLGVLVAPASAATVLHVDDVVTINVAAAELVAAPDGSAIYATVRHNLSQPATLHEIDPAGGTIARTYTFEHDVGFALAISTDSSTAYVAATNDDYYGVFEIDLATFRMVRHADVGQVSGVLPVPGDPTRYLVSRGSDGIDLIDDGAVVDSFDGGDLRQEAQLFAGGSSTRFYASATDRYDDDLSRLYAFDVGPSSLSLVGDVLAPVTTGHWAWDDGRLVMNDGRVMDPVDLSIDATYLGVTSIYTTEVVVDVDRDRVYFDDGGRVNEYRRSDQVLEAEPRLFQNSQVDRLALSGDFLVAGGIYSTAYSIPLGDGPWVASVPTDLHATSPAGGLTLTWHQPADDGGSPITAYEVWRDGELLATTSADVRTYVDPSAAPVDWHQYRISAVNAAGTSLGSEPVDVVYAPAFSDVRPSHTFYEEIRWAAENGIVGGFPDRTFRGNGHVTRQAMAAFLYRLAANPAYQPPPEPDFPDVGADHPFFTEIEWMVEAGLTTGFQDGRFRPGATVTRQAMSAYLCRLVDCTSTAPPVSTLPVVFPDVPRSHPFFLEITFAYFGELADGYPNGTFRPSGVITRQAATAFLYRLVQQITPEAGRDAPAGAPAWPVGDAPVLQLEPDAQSPAG